MSQSRHPTIGTTISSFHAMAQARGDGLHPQLMQALAKSGSVSGPPAPSEQNSDNIVQISFGARASSTVENRELAK